MDRYLRVPLLGRDCPSGLGLGELPKTPSTRSSQDVPSKTSLNKGEEKGRGCLKPRPRCLVELPYRPDKVSPTLSSNPLSLRSCLSRSLSASLALVCSWRILSFCAASSPAAATLCWAWPSAFLPSSPVMARRLPSSCPWPYPSFGAASSWPFGRHFLRNPIT